MAEEGAPVGREYQGAVNPTIIRTYEEDMKFIKRVSPVKFEIQKGECLDSVILVYDE